MTLAPGVSGSPGAEPILSRLPAASGSVSDVQTGEIFLGLGKSSCVSQCHADHSFLMRDHSSTDPSPAQAVWLWE